MNAGVHKGALRRFLGNADYIGLPYIDPVFIYKAEYSASLPWNVPQIRAAASPAISELLERLGTLAEPKGVTVIHLEVRESNTPARTLYEKLGFTVDGIRKNYYERPRENAVLMTRYLK